MQTDLLLQGLPHFDKADDYAAWLDETLPRPRPHAGAPKVLDLFAGCGGLGLGFEAAGFRSIGFESDRDAAASYSMNLVGGCRHTELHVGEPSEAADIIIGGPPCQPYSQIGNQKGRDDSRDGFPIFLDAVRRIEPRLAIIENVRGLLFRNKDILREAVAELERLAYVVEIRLLNTLDYGVAQNRERVIIVAHRGGWEWPATIVASPVTAGVALGTSATEVRADSRFLTASMDRYVEAYERKSHCVTPRDLHLDRPARTLTCRNLAGATADMHRIKLPDGRRRMLHIEEAARLQSFPSWFRFEGSLAEQAAQIGNAVAPLMALALGRQAMIALEKPMPPSRRRSANHTVLGDSSPRAVKIEQALVILAEVGIPLRDMTARKRERAALCLLAIAHLRPESAWSESVSHLEDNAVGTQRSRDNLDFRNTHYSEGLSRGSYDDVRRIDLALLMANGLAQNSAGNLLADTNDGTRGYALTLEALALLRAFRSPRWEDELKRFREHRAEAMKNASAVRTFAMLPVTIADGKQLLLAPGPHNRIQKAVIEQFLPRFSHAAQLLYVGDAENKELYVDRAGFDAIGLQPPSRGERLPDIVAYEARRNWLFLIEAVHSSNPISAARHAILERITQATSAGRIYVTAFASRVDFASWLRRSGISRETEV